MRNRTINHISASLLWLALCALPLLMTVFFAVHHTPAEVDAWVNGFTGVMQSVPMYSIINQTIGPDGYLPLIPSSLSFMVDFATFGACVVFARFVLSILLFIPNVISDVLCRAREKVRL